MAFRAEVAFLVEVPPVMVEVRRFLSDSSVSADSSLYHFSMEGSRPCDFYKPLPGFVLSQPSDSNAKETQLLASSILRLRHEVS